MGNALGIVGGFGKIDQAAGLGRSRHSASTGQMQISAIGKQRSLALALTCGFIV